MHNLYEYSLYTFSETVDRTRPEQISLSTAVIAEASPGQLDLYMQSSEPSHVENTFGERLQHADQAQEQLDMTIALAAKANLTLKLLEEHVSEQTRHGKAPSAEELSLLFAIPEIQAWSVKELEELIEKHLPGIKRDLREAEQAEEAKEKYFRTQTKLRQEILEDMSELSRPGRMAIIGAYALFGTGSAIWQLFTQTPENSTPGTLAVAGLTSAGIVAVGYFTSTRPYMKRALAHRKARQIMKGYLQAGAEA